jgi:NAD(P)-dependent dehydrogenase (short-subunit alcohol dehydrogenase family)
VLITGATDGIGKQTARLLATLGAHVIVHGRARERVDATIALIDAEAREAARTRKQEPPPIEGVVADFSSLRAVRAMATQFMHRPIDVLVNNAGLYRREREVSLDGFEMTLAVNYLAPLVLTHMLLPSLHRSGRGRIVNVSSVVHIRCRLEWDNLQSEIEYDDYQAYATSTLGLVLMAGEMGRRIADGTTINSMHPGTVSTKLLKEGFGVDGDDKIENAASMIGYLALARDVAKTTGKYFSEGHVTRAHSLAGDPLTAGRFYEMTTQMAGIEPLPKRRPT